MFDLEQSIAEWRKQMLAAGIKSPMPLDELEIHLREEIEQQMKSGMNEQKVFEISVQKIGQAKPLKIEFKKLDAEKWNRSLAWAAWITFAISFFLPAYRDHSGFVHMTGAQCAFLQDFFWPQAMRGDLSAIHLELLTLANLLMIAWSFLLLRFSQNARFMKWLHYSSFAVLILVWSFLLLLITHEEGKNLKVGCYVWAVSFLLLCLSTLKLRNRKAHFTVG